MVESFILHIFFLHPKSRLHFDFHTLKTNKCNQINGWEHNLFSIAKFGTLITSQKGTGLLIWDQGNILKLSNRLCISNSIPKYCIKCWMLDRYTNYSKKDNTHQEHETRQKLTHLFEESSAKCTSNLKAAFYSIIDNTVFVIRVFILYSSNFLQIIRLLVRKFFQTWADIHQYHEKGGYDYYVINLD